MCIIFKIAKLAGFPKNDLRFIHVAGTKGDSAQTPLTIPFSLIAPCCINKNRARGTRYVWRERKRQQRSFETPLSTPLEEE